MFFGGWRAAAAAAAAATHCRKSLLPTPLSLSGKRTEQHHRAAALIIVISAMLLMRFSLVLKCMTVRCTVLYLMLLALRIPCGTLSVPRSMQRWSMMEESNSDFALHPSLARQGALR